MTLSDRIVLIRTAIARVKESADYVRMTAIDPAADSGRITTVKARHVFVLADFGYQWENVEAVLDALAPDLEFK